MEIFDYRSNTIEDVGMEIDKLTNKEREKVAEAVKSIKQNSVQEKSIQWSAWFDIAILPVLKEFAELSGSLLEIQRDDKHIISVTLRNPVGIYVTESCISIRMALNATVMITIDHDDNEAVLSLIYDCNKFI